MKPNLPPIANSIIETLSLKLPPSLVYHNVGHTLTVIKEVNTLGVMDSLSSREIELLTVAAAFHDAGFLVQKEENESIGAEMARKALTASKDYSEQEINEICDSILSTALFPDFSRKPITELSKYLLDADLGSLGRDDFFEKSELLIKELNIERSIFFLGTAQLMAIHEWYTPAAKSLYQEKKDENLMKLKNLLVSGA